MSCEEVAKKIMRTDQEQPSVDPSAPNAAIDFTEALLATGLPWKDAVEAAVGIHGEAALPVLTRYWREQETPEILDVLRAIGTQSPGLAESWCLRGLNEGMLGVWETCVYATDDGSCDQEWVLGLDSLPWLNTLPPGMTVQGDFILSSCHALRSLPDDLRVMGDLKIINCDGLTTLPGTLQVGGDLRVQGCRRMETIPVGLVGHAHDLNVCGCPGLKSLSGRLEVWHCAIMDCPVLESIPGDGRVGSLSLRACPAISSLPDWVDGVSDLELVACDGVTHLPVIRELENLRITDCKEFKDLPPGLCVRQWMVLDRCLGFVRFPDGLVIEGDMRLLKCVSWDGQIPLDAIIQGKMALDGHEEGIELGTWRRRYPFGARSEG